MTINFFCVSSINDHIPALQARGVTVEFGTSQPLVTYEPVTIPDVNLRTAIAAALRKRNAKDATITKGDMTTLAYLGAQGAGIRDLTGLEFAPNLTALDLDNNNLTDISALSGLTNLGWLALNGNNLTDISPLRHLTNLYALALYYNNLTDISALSGLTNLEWLVLLGNPLSASSISSHIPRLQDRGVEVLFNPNPFRESEFDIEFVFLDSFTDSQKNVFRIVARQWTSVITEDLPDYEFTQNWAGTCGDQSFEIPAGERIDDLRIYVTSFEGGNAVGRGGPHLLRETHLPVLGCMAFDLKRADLLITGLHEIGHVLGFGTVWDNLGLRQNPSGDTHFNGPRAIAAFNDAGGRNYSGAKVPLEKMDGGHWRHSVLAGELMLPGGGGSLSAITVQSLADLGYGVDVTQADPFTLPDAASAKVSAKITAALPFISDVDVTQADAYTLSGVQGWGAAALPSIPIDDRFKGRLESDERIRGRGFDPRKPSMGRLAPQPQAEPKPLCGSHLRQEPIYVVNEQGRIVRTLHR